jgi:hypothetical protein
MKTILKKLLPFMGLLLFSCSPEDVTDGTETTKTPDSNTSRISNSTIIKTWNFNDLNEWQDASMNTNGILNYWIDNGNLNIFTNANTWERSKVKTISTFTSGTYTWRIYIPEMGIGDMASIGAFLYYNDSHELDFEVGYGTLETRTSLNAAADDLIVYMTSQGNPFQSFKTKIKREQWYTLSIELTLNSNGKYNANWKINGQSMGIVQLTYGSKAKFKIFCSVENLQFIGDHIPNSQNRALFDFVEFKGN